MNLKYFFKYSFVLILVVLITALFQRLRVKRLESYFAIKQSYDFTLQEAKNGKLNIEKPEKYIILYSDEKYGVGETKDALKNIFNFSRVKYDEKPISTTENIDYSNYSMIIIVAENYKGLTRENFLKIKEYVKDGGKLFFTQRALKNPFSSLAGIDKIGEFITTNTFVFNKKIFPGFKNLVSSHDYFGSSGLDIKLKENLENINVIATTSNGIPLMWIVEYGNGKVFYNNSTLFQGKIFRGIMKQLIAYMSDVSFYPVINSKVLHIDDYPSPIPVINHEILKKEYGMDTNEFFNTIWWKDMQGIFYRQRVVPTGLLIGEYNDATTSDKIVAIGKRTLGDLSKRGRQLKSVGGELAMHGYNHYSLGLKGDILFSKYGYAPWEDVQTMEKAQRVLKETVKKLYGNTLHIYTYIPPSNLFSKSGKEAIINVFPEIKAFCGIFYGDEEPGLLIQEVGRDPDFPNIYALPRMSSGDFYTGEILWQIYNSIGAYGYVSHFVHPDDIIDEDRGKNKTWEELSYELESIFKNINENYPVMKPQTQSEMTYEYMKIENIDVDYEKKANKIFINVKNFQGNFDAQLRIRDNKIRSIKGGKFTLLEKTKEYSLYMITVTSPEVIIDIEKLN